MGNARRARSMIVLSMLLFSLYVLGVGIAMAVRSNSTVCVAALRWPMLFVGLAFVVVCFMGCCGVMDDDDDCLKTLYLFGLFFVLLALIVLFIFNYVAVSGKYWGPVSACLRHRNICDGISQLAGDPKTGKNWTSSDDSSLIISPVQSGCCKPPSSCGFTYVNGTTWSPSPTPNGEFRNGSRGALNDRRLKARKRGAPSPPANHLDPPETTPGAGDAPAPAASVTNDDDCSRWSNDPRTLCFQCASCKASVLDRSKAVWLSDVTITLTVLLVFLVCVYPCHVADFEECDRLGL